MGEMIVGALLVLFGFFLGCVFMVLVAAARKVDDG